MQTHTHSGSTSADIRYNSNISIQMLNRMTMLQLIIMNIEDVSRALAGLEDDVYAKACSAVVLPTGIQLKGLNELSLTSQLLLPGSMGLVEPPYDGAW